MMQTFILFVQPNLKQAGISFLINHNMLYLLSGLSDTPTHEQTQTHMNPGEVVLRRSLRICLVVRMFLCWRFLSISSTDPLSAVKIEGCLHLKHWSALLSLTLRADTFSWHERVLKGGVLLKSVFLSRVLKGGRPLLKLFLINKIYTLIFVDVYTLLFCVRETWSFCSLGYHEKVKVLYPK